MKKVIFLSVFAFLLSCENISSLSQREAPNPSVKKLSPQVQIYLSEKDQFMTVSEINRNHVTLGLFDQIVFSSKAEKDPLFFLEPLENFETEEEMKMKIFSSCSYTSAEEHRVSEEWASRSYHPSFSIVNLLPKNIVLHGLEQSFYCSFIVSFKSKDGRLKYYNIAQQKITPSLSRNIQANKLSLVRENDSGYYSPVEGMVEKKYINKVLLLNNTGNPVTEYHLFCEGLKVMTVPDFKVNVAPVFLNLMGIDLGELEGVQKCHFFSENNKKITGITNSFQLDFSGLNKRIEPVDLQKISAPVIAKFFGEEYSKGHEIPLTSYVYFKNFNEVAGENYSSVELIADTQCIDNNPDLNLFGKGDVVSKQVRFPLRARFPVMSLTPEELFSMGPAYDQWLTWNSELQDRYNHPIIPPNCGMTSCYHDPAELMVERAIEYHRVEKTERAKMNHYVSCIYKMKLQDKYHPENIKKFEDMYYTLQWDRSSYGIEYIALDEKVNPFEPAEGQKSFEKLVKKMGSLKINGFDHSFFVQDESYVLDAMKLKCLVNSTKNKETWKPIRFLWPYDAFKNGNGISLQAVFSNTQVQNHISNGEKMLCRLMFYEKGLLRYFSGEMRLEW